jgi:hypothetical protein
VPGLFEDRPAVQKPDCVFGLTYVQPSRSASD